VLIGSSVIAVAYCNRRGPRDGVAPRTCRLGDNRGIGGAK
jgi:hypothetical protein